MKTPSSALFELIKRMTKEEKKYFSRFIFLEKRDAKSNLLYEMFCSLDSMTTYDEAALKEWFKDKLKGDSLKTFKSLLKETILKGLRSQKICLSIENTIQEKLQYAEILKSKGIEKEAIKVLNSVKEMYLPEFYIATLVQRMQIISNKMLLIVNISESNSKDITKLAEESSIVSSEIRHASIAYEYSMKLSYISSNCLLLQTEKEKEDFKKFSLSFEKVLAKYNQNNEPLFVTQGRATKALIENNYPLALENIKSIDYQYSHWYHCIKVPRNDDFVFYGKILFSFINYSILNRREECLSFSLMRVIMGYNKSPFNVGSEYYLAVYLYGDLVKYHWKRNKKVVDETIKNISKLWLWKEPNPNMMLFRTIATQLAIVFHYEGKFEEAKTWLRKVNNTDYKNTEYVHFVEFCTLFEFIVDYDSENSNTILSKSFNYSVESAYERIRKHPEKDRNYTATFLLFFKKAAEHDTETKRQQSIEKLKNDLNSLKNTNTSVFFNALFDYNSWVEKLETKNRSEAA